MKRPIFQARIQRGQGGRTPPPPPPLKNHKNIGFPSNTGPDPLKIIQYCAIICTPAKRRFTGGPMMACLL